jgi:hypothetical protein
MLDCPGAWGRSIRVGSFIRETSTTRQSRGNVKSMCGKSHVHWDATLEPTQIDDAIPKGVHPKDHKFGSKKKK